MTTRLDGNRAVLVAVLLAARMFEVAAQVNVCYFTNWARYRSGLINQGKDVFEMGLDGNLCTHVMYGFATVTTGDFQLLSNDPNADYPSGSGAQTQLCPAACNDPTFKADWSDPNAQRCDWPCSPTRVYRGYEGATVGLKRKNPNVKALISVGGWNFNDCSASRWATYGQGEATCEIFSTIASSEANSRAFAQQVIAFCEKWGFDGFDIDWEYPVVEGHNSLQKQGGSFVNTTQDYANYVNLLRILKEEFVKRRPLNPLLLTAAVGVGKSTVDAAYNIPEMDRYLDLVNLMTYDLHGAWESRTGCNANLYATAEDTQLGGGVGSGVAVQGYPLSVSWAVDYWLQRGASPSKVTMGLGTYGRGWKLALASNSGYNSPASGASTPGVSTKEAGYLAFYEVQELLRSGRATRYYDVQRQCPYVVTAAGDWIGYDDEQSLQAKVDFARSRGLAGTMFWAMDLDDFAGAYGGKTPYPLIWLARRAMSSGSSTTSVAASSTSSATSWSTSSGASSSSSTPASTVSTSTKAATTSSSRPATTTSTRQPQAASSTTQTVAAATSTSQSRVPSVSTTTTTTTSTRVSTSGVGTTPASTSSSTPATGGSCVRNKDCTVNAWCKDVSYDSWCASMGNAGWCPAPQCKVAVAAASATSAFLAPAQQPLHP